MTRSRAWPADTTSGAERRLECGRRMVRRLLECFRYLGGHAGRAQAEHVRDAAGGGA